MKFPILLTLYQRWRASIWAVPFLLISLTAIELGVACVVRQPYDGLGWSTFNGEVTSIAANGPGAKAGLLVGDTILTIAGQPTARASPPYAGKQAGDHVVFTLRRAGQLLTAELTLEHPPLGNLLGSAELLLIALCMWSISVVVLALRPAFGEAQLFFLLNQVGSGVIATGLISSFGFQEASCAFNVLLCWLSPLIVHFHSIFPTQRPNRRFILLKPFYGGAVVLTLICSLLSALNLTVSYAASLLYVAVRSYFALALLVTLILLFRNYRLAPTRNARRRIRFVILGSGLALAPLVVLSLVQEILNYPVLPYEFSFLFLLLIPLSYAYGIYNYNLFDTDRILNRSLVHFVLTMLFSILFLSLMGILHWAFPGPVSNYSFVGTLLVLIMIWTFPPLQSMLQSLADRFLYGSWYHYSDVVSQFSQALSTAIEECRLSQLLVNELTSILRIRGAALLILSEEGELIPICCNRATSCPCDSPGKCLAYRVRPEAVRLDGTLAAYLQQQARPVGSTELRRALTRQDLAPTEAALIEDQQIQVWLPLLFQEELEGFLLLGTKMADDLYSTEDYQILETLAWQVATAARNVSLLRALRRQLQELVQGKQELQEAHRRLLMGGEEERKHLAREIHDVPVQELIGLSYRLRDYMRQAPDSSLEGSLKELRGEILRILEELRRICTNLRPPILDAFGLAAAIRAHALEEARAGPQITLDLDEQAMVSKDVAIALFRIYQEATANAIRHANATRILVRLEAGANSCTLSVSDNGQGFIVPERLEALAREGHLGLLGMRERVEALAGELEVNAVPSAGTEVRAWVPLTAPGLSGLREAANGTIR